jgi:hypothetical protein
MDECIYQFVMVDNIGLLGLQATNLVPVGIGAGEGMVNGHDFQLAQGFLDGFYRRQRVSHPVDQIFSGTQ